MSKKQVTKEALLETARRLFTERGYKSVSTRDLADAAGVNLAAIQYHFGSKAKLFVEVIHHLMIECGCVEARLDYRGPIETPSQAAGALAEYIVGFLQYLLDPDGPKACQMMMREVCTDHSDDPEMFETLISSVAEKFMRPIEESLVHAIGILNPRMSKCELLSAARSIEGQCFFYGNNRTFLQRLDQKDLCAEGGVRVIARHIAEFSLRGISCSEDLIQEVRTWIEKTDLEGLKGN